MAMIESETEADRLRCCLETLAFLLLDKANRKVVNELRGLDLIMRVFQRASDPNVQISALDALHSLVKSEDADKERLWAHPQKQLVLGMAKPKLGAGQLCEVLCLLRKMSFRTIGNELELLEPGLLAVLSNLLAPTLPHPVLLKALKVLRYCAECAGNDHLNSWHLIVFKLVPLLRDSVVCEATLNVLLPLSEHMAFKNLFMAAGAIPPLLALLLHPVKSVAVTATCVISCLSDVGLSREQLCQEPALVALMRTLQHNRQHVDVNIGILYTLNRLAGAKPVVVATMHRHNAPQLLLRLLQRWSDEDLVLAALQLLETVGAPASVDASTSSSATTTAAPTPRPTQQADVVLAGVEAAEVQQASGSSDQAAAGPRDVASSSPSPASSCTASSLDTLSLTSSAASSASCSSTSASVPMSSAAASASAAAARAEAADNLKASLQRGMVHVSSRASLLAAAGYAPADASVIIENMA